MSVYLFMATNVIVEIEFWIWQNKLRIHITHSKHLVILIIFNNGFYGSRKWLPRTVCWTTITIVFPSFKSPIDPQIFHRPWFPSIHKCGIIVNFMQKLSIESPVDFCLELWLYDTLYHNELTTRLTSCLVQSMRVNCSCFICVIEFKKVLCMNKHLSLLGMRFSVDNFCCLQWLSQDCDLEGAKQYQKLDIFAQKLEKSNAAPSSGRRCLAPVRMSQWHVYIWKLYPAENLTNDSVCFSCINMWANAWRPQYVC